MRLEKVNFVPIRFHLFMKSNYIKFLHISVLLLLPVIYIYFASRYFWALPGPSDPLMYLGYSIHHAAGSFRFVDRFVVVIGLSIFNAIFHPEYIAGPYYILSVNSLIIVIAIFWSYIKKGFFAALLAGILLISSFHFLAYATYIYADQTMSLFALLAFIFFYSQYKTKWLNRYILAGLFTALACFSKVSGCAIMIPFAITIFAEKKWGESIRFLLGFLCGVLLVFSAALGLFGWNSISGVFKAQVSEMSNRAQSHFAIFNGSLSYFNTLVTENFLPIYFSMIIFIGAYKKKLTRDLYLAAISFIAVLTVLTAASMYMITSPNYIYPAVIFGSLGMALYLSDLREKKGALSSAKMAFMDNNGFSLIFGIICMILVIFAMKTGISFSNSFLHPIDQGVPRFIRMAYTIIPIIIVGLLLFIEYSKSRFTVLIFTTIICIWVPAYTGAYAYATASENRIFGEYFIERAPVINKIPEGNLSIYIEEWNKYHYVDRLPVIYYNLFNNKKHPEILIITDKKNMPMAVGDQILTDNPQEVSKYFPQARVIDHIRWKGSVLTVLQISKIPQGYDYEMDFSRWKGPDTIGLADIDKTIAPLRYLGERGVYSLTRINSEGSRIIRINFVKVHPTDPPELYLGFKFLSEDLGRRIKNGYVTLSIFARFSAKSTPSSLLFIQENIKNENWEKIVIPVNEISWTEYRITKKIRKEATEIAFGISFKPQAENDWIEIKDIKVAGWPSR